MCKVLLVDDEHLERQALRIIIDEGIEGAYVVGETGLGREAIELSEKLDPDIIFMDIRMPGINGIEATEAIKKMDNKKIVIILTAYDEFTLAQRAIKAKANDYILKPARPEVVIETIKRHINETKSRKNSFEPKLQKFINLIRCGDFKGSKEMLKEIITHILLIYPGSFDKLKVYAEKLANNMMITSKKIGLEINKIGAYDIDFKLSTMNDINEIEKWLFMIHNDIFEEIMEKRIYYSDNELFLALNYIEKNYQKGITLEDVADYVNLSPSYLSKVFKKELDINFSTYLTKRRIERAKELLENTDMPILNIAIELSYNESNYFSKVFKKVEGMTPSQYRNKKKIELEKKLKNNLLTRHVSVSNGKWQI